MPTAAPAAALMDEDCREMLRRHFEEKINKTSTTALAPLRQKPQQQQQQPARRKYELVAAFSVISGDIVSYWVYRDRVPFQLTERRRRIIRTYYRSGEWNLLLYVNGSEFEHYMPLRYVTARCAHEKRLRARYLEAAAAEAAAVAGGRKTIRFLLGRGALPEQ